ALREQFPEGADDEEWIPWAAKEQRIILSNDIARSKGEKAIVLARNGAIAFFFASGFNSLTFWPKLEKLVHYFPAIEQEAQKANPGDIFDVRLNKGGIEKRTWATTRRPGKR
ncbi:MAG TPA: hypothetical protein VEJ41_00980, partial [Candidatus Acidoferrales bacterium]|nr:hypothetical protein [Candidatus Acidoferrales bacterium]